MEKEKRICVICGQSFSPKSPKQLCCSSACANKKSHESRRKYYPCQNCGTLFWKKDAFRKKYCCKECQAEARRKESHPKLPKTPTKYHRFCEWCNQPFETSYPNQKYCSKDCGYQGNLSQKRQQWSEKYVSKTFVCKECGTEFVTECGHPRSVFCCDRCAERHERRKEHATERHKVYMNQSKEKRKRMIRKAFVEDVDYDAVFIRDGGICKICGLPAFHDKLQNTFWSGTIDHIVPLSCGGEHSMDNCQLAHRICNSIKGASRDAYIIDWESKSLEDNVWKQKYSELKETMRV